MNGFFRRFTLLFLGVTVIFAAFGAEKVTFTTKAPMIVAAGDAFRVEFRLNAKPDDDTFEAPDFEGFEVIAGPAVYRGQSMQYVNGSVTNTYEFTYTFVLLPSTPGNYTIGSARIEVDGESHRTQPVPVEVIDEGAQAPGTAQSAPAESEANRQSPAARQKGEVAADDILLRVQLSRTSVYKGEPVLAAIKLYYRIPIVGINEVKFPSFNGFWAQELDVENRPARRETVNGKVYECSVLKEYLLYPQQSGTLAVDPAELTAVAQIVVQNNRSRDPFFGNMPDVYNVDRKLRSQKIPVTVKELPAGAPESFTGAVGRFSMTETPPPAQLAANSAATYTLRISGSGNLRFVQAPKLPLPASFELYDVKSSEQIKTAGSGASGYRQFEYPFIARAEGDYTAGPVEFTYFDPARSQYVTLSGQPLHLTVTPDASGGTGEARIVKGLSKEEVKMLGEDIRFIRSGKPRLVPAGRPLLFSAPYFASLAVMLLAFAGLYTLMRKRIRDSRNSAHVRGKRANKVAVQRVRAAGRAMNEQNQYAFYEEMSRALWGYMSDKLNIPVANLTKENVREELTKRGVAAEEAQHFTDIITRCEEAQYSPMASAQMSEVYTRGVEFISRMESLIKKRK